VALDYGTPAVRYVSDTAQKVHREKHRMEAFVRFQKTADDLFFSVVEPDFNVLPLIIRHFSERYADQKWLIYDKKRKYGIYYDMSKTSFVQIDMETPIGNAELGSVLNESEHAYQQLWRDYFNSTNIKARKNMKLHIRHMPLRYWKYLTEKMPEI
jgi:probable DNA metabolism protein